MSLAVRDNDMLLCAAIRFQVMPKKAKTCGASLAAVQSHNAQSLNAAAVALRTSCPARCGAHVLIILRRAWRAPRAFAASAAWPREVQDDCRHG